MLGLMARVRAQDELCKNYLLSSRRSLKNSSYLRCGHNNVPEHRLGSQESTKKSIPFSSQIVFDVFFFLRSRENDKKKDFESRGREKKNKWADFPPVSHHWPQTNESCWQTSWNGFFHDATPSPFPESKLNSAIDGCQKIRWEKVELGLKFRVKKSNQMIFVNHWRCWGSPAEVLMVD